MLTLKSCKPCKRSAAFCSNQRSVLCRASSGAANKLTSAAAAVVLSSGLAVFPALASGVSFPNIQSGATVSSPLHLEFAVDGLTVKPAAEGIVAGTGHHHVIIDAPAPAAGTAIPFDDAHKHFGKGQTSVDLELPPGKHTLTLQFANAAHESYGPEFASTISVIVE
ncbi:hypothetical protein VOLCADRAFT_121558 [Volvox carteri f. nagariensis]|uniref:DUF4399 domain-containing protein n=1 Tax=Volvox carteri f. nagariensis TaxID=3068 RepID=D8UDE4_VOLCA|nr:uncharacterized protein VOLCADRAFT_121558 [Volvox carteri f. nagariensis]EFJ42297.1 hypothetical protein VOLCADRAFT_121558 [Volvox carteri f. nagariensis]|eukprot:XP_002956695.1 hypothetical protein VOLCADRAFT_121558 [Volvox carteri f. nagariensis]